MKHNDFDFGRLWGNRALCHVDYSLLPPRNEEAVQAERERARKRLAQEIHDMHTLQGREWERGLVPCTCGTCLGTGYSEHAGRDCLDCEGGTVWGLPVAETCGELPL